MASVALGLSLAVVALLLGRRELRLYRERNRGERAPGRVIDLDRDLFRYSRGRLWRRMLGVGVIAAVGATIAAWELLPPRSPGEATTYLALLLGELAILVALPLLDLWETARTARPGELSSADPSPRTRTAPDRRR
jgi:hypothetical protein